LPCCCKCQPESTAMIVFVEDSLVAMFGDRIVWGTAVGIVAALLLYVPSLNTA
jgi:hypothetical protein